MQFSLRRNATKSNGGTYNGIFFFDTKYNDINWDNCFVFYFSVSKIGNVTIVFFVCRHDMNEAGENTNVFSIYKIQWIRMAGNTIVFSGDNMLLRSRLRNIQTYFYHWHTILGGKWGYMQLSFPGRNTAKYTWRKYNCIVVCGKMQWSIQWEKKVYRFLL